MNHSIDYQTLLETSLVATEPNNSYYSPVLNIRIRTYSWESPETCKNVLSPNHWETLSEQQRSHWILKASGWWLVVQATDGSTSIQSLPNQQELDRCFDEMRKVFRTVTGK